MIECKGCGTENLFNGYTAHQFLNCTQCRDRLIAPDLDETHREFVCQDCELVLVLLEKTEITPGEATCRCGGHNIVAVNTPSILTAAAAAGALDHAAEMIDPEEDFDWCRSESNETGLDDFNELFDKDPAQ